MSKTTRAQASLVRLHALLLELGCLSEGAGALAADPDGALVISYHSDDFAAARRAKQALAAFSAVYITLLRTAADG